ncbi:MAG: hypothetical protein ACYCO3_13650, partial [Mycobacteriales bacterium]
SAGHWAGAVNFGGRLITGPGVAYTTGGLAFYAESTNRELYFRTAATNWVAMGGVLGSGPAAAAD